MFLKRKIFKLLIFTTVFMNRGVAVMASSDATAKAAAEASKFVANLNNAIIFPTIGLLSVIALAVFIWGCLEYVMNANNEQYRRKGVDHITYGIIGLLVMSSAWLILSLVANTFGLSEDLTCADDPNATGCDAYFKAPGS